jgi:hypothetical protein
MMMEAKATAIVLVEAFSRHSDGQYGIRRRLPILIMARRRQARSRISVTRLLSRMFSTSRTRPEYKSA